MEDELGLMIAKSVAIALLLVFIVIGLVMVIYDTSGAKERAVNRAFDCKGKGGEMIYIRGTGDVCIKGIIKLDEK